MDDALNINNAADAGEEADAGGKIEENAEAVAENLFLSSLNRLSEADIELNAAAKAAKKPPIDFLRYFILLVCLSVFVYAGYSIVKQLFEYAEAAQDNTALRELFYGREDALGEMRVMRRARQARPIQDILALQRQTVREVSAVVAEGMAETHQTRVMIDRIFADIPDMFGWIRISHTNVDYPVVQWTDNEHFLRRNVHGFQSNSGAIYADFRNDRNMDNNLHTILYGHNMQNGTKFSSIVNFDRSREAFDEGLIELITPDGIYIFEVFSVHKVCPRYRYRDTWFPDDETFVAFLYHMKSLSRFEKEGIVFTPESRIITLSTCTNTWRNPRLAVHGVLIERLRFE